MAEFEFKKITLDDMKAYIDKNAPKDKEWFKSIAIDDDGKYNHLETVRAFCNKYMPEIIPVAKPKAKSAIDKLKEW